MTLKAKFVCYHWINNNMTATGESFEFDVSAAVRKMGASELADLRALVAGSETPGFSASPDLDFLAVRTGAVNRHAGPFNVELDADALEDFITAGMPGRYVVSDGWGHFFQENAPESITRWVYDRESERLVAGAVRHGHIHPEWEPLDAVQFADIEDSLKTANEDALLNPGHWDLQYADEIPAEFTAFKRDRSVRKVAVITVAFDDPDDNITSTSDMATFVEAALSRSVPGVVVTAYSSTAALAADIADGHDPLQDELAGGAAELESEQPAPVPGR